MTFEFEDVVAACDDHAFVDASTVPTQNLARYAWRSTRALALVVDRRREVHGDELVFAMAQSPTDLADHLAHRSKIRSAGTSAAYIEEMWVRNLPLQPDVRRLLREFDHVFVGCEATVIPLSEHIERPVTYLPPSVDQDRFAASPWPPASIDVYAMGRRHPDLHDALLRWAAADRSRFYLYDTFAGNPPISDHQQHRDKLADLIRRSRYFLANEAKVDRPDHTNRQSEVGYRFFEGAAAGAVMIGSPVSAPAFGRLFDWDEPTVVVDPSGHDVADRIKELDEDPQRHAGIRRRNAAGSLRKHDPVHRWQVVLDTLGVEQPTGVHERVRRLNERADTVDPAAGRSDV